MKFLLSLSALATTCAALAQGASEAILSYSDSISGYADATVGWTFQTTNALTVTELGCFTKVFEDNPAVTSVQVGLWTDSGSLLASSSVTPGSSLSDETRYEAVTPVALAPGQVYHLGVLCSGGGIGLDVAGPSAGGSVSAAPPIQVGGLAYGTSGFTSPPALSGTAGLIYAGPNFQFQFQPPLAIQFWTNNQVRLSWLTAFPGYTLQSEAGLSGVWSNASLSVTNVGIESVAFDTIGAGPKYYRLIK
jgi:hypothetical protein